MDAAKKWFFEYVKTLDPTRLQQESAVMLHAFLDGIFGKDLELEQGVLDVIDQWISIINEDAEISGQLITSYQTYLQNLNPNKSFPYEAITRYCTNAEELVSSYIEVSKYDMVLQLLKVLDVDAVERTDENYKDRVDAVLVNLMSNYDDEERQLRNEAEYFNLIIRNEGFTEKAEAQYQAAMSLQKDSFNIGKQMISWAIYDETANAGVRKFAFQNTKEWFKSAMDRFSIQMEQAFPIEYRLSIDTWNGISNGYDQAELTENMRNYYETNKFQNMFVNTPNIAAVIIFIASIALAFVTPYSLVATALAVVFLGYRCYKALDEYPKRVEAAMLALRQTLAEIGDFRQYYDENSRKKDTILSETEFI